MSNSKTFCIVTNNVNCERHTQYSLKIKKYFTLNGYHHVDNLNADKLIIMGCGFHNQMYDKVVATIKQALELRVLKEDIYCLGCIPKTHGKLLMEQGIKVFPFYKEELLDQEIEAAVKYKDIQEINELSLDETSILDDECYYIRVAEGCLMQCTFCVINKAKGYIRSLDEKVILEQYKYAINNGYKKIFLMGEDTLAYGYDNGKSLFDLIDKMLDIESDVTFYFGSLHCRWIEKYSKELIELSEKKKINKIHIGVQHTNPQVLERMGRHTNFASAYETLKTIKEKNKDLYVSCDILVGFPGEIKEQFAELCEFLSTDTVFSMVSHYGYSDVVGARSNLLDNKLSTIEVGIRWNKINKILCERSGYRNTFKDEKNLIGEKKYFYI